MEKYISKDRIIAAIKERFDEYSNSILKHYDACKEAKAQELGKILTIIDTLEVKEIKEEAVVREVKVDAGGYPYIGETELYDYDNDIPLAKKGDKFNMILIKED